MSIERWSENLIVAHLSDDPQFSEDMHAIESLLATHHFSAVLNFAAVGYLNSSSIARLLMIRKRQIQNNAHLILCGLSTQLWSVFLVTGIDKIFDCRDDVSASLATVQLKDSQPT